MADAMVEALERHGDPTRVKRILRRVDTMLGQYMFFSYLGFANAKSIVLIATLFVFY
jgi:hypothetical protein